MPTYNYPFSGGATGIQGYGDRWQIMFAGTWAGLEEWGIIVTSSAGNFDLGSINFFQQNPNFAFNLVFKNRVYLSTGLKVNFSDNGDPTGWNQQNPGAGAIQYLSYFGASDSVNSMSQLQGRLVLIARRSVQIWSVDADPANFALVQEMDNIGTNSPKASQNLGDFDVIILDDTGFRSLRTREVTLNAYVDDVGTSVDQLVQTDLQSVTAGGPSIVEPSTKNYWCYLNGKIYVLSRHPGSKIQAWSTYSPTYQASVASGSFNSSGNLAVSGLTIGGIYNFVFGNAISIIDGSRITNVASGNNIEYIPLNNSITIVGPLSTLWTGNMYFATSFTPEEFVVFQGKVYCRSVQLGFFTYGGSGGGTYGGSIVQFQTPWMEHKRPSHIKTSSGIDVAIAGKWIVQASMDPKNQVFETAITQGSPSNPVMSSDSTFDSQRYEYTAEGTHLGLLCRTTADRVAIARFAALVWHYELNNPK